MKLKRVKELPPPPSTARDRWSPPIIEYLRANPGNAYELFDGPRKLILIRHAYLKRTCPDITSRYVVSKSDPEKLTLYGKADGTIS